MPFIPPLPGQKMEEPPLKFLACLLIVIAIIIGGVYYHQSVKREQAREPERWRDVGKLTDLEFTPAGNFYITRIETEQGVWHVRGCISTERMRYVQISDRGRLAISSKPYEIMK